MGHAGFCVETSDAIIIMDPWLSPSGAFDGAWFQFPRNHHLAAYVQDKLNNKEKERFVYISHEHKDHFDLRFLNSIENRNFTLITAKFQRQKLREILKNYECKKLVSLQDGEQVTFADGTMKLFLIDTELNRDSSILVKTTKGSFLNLNDCKLIERLPDLVAREGQIDVLAAQYSGAIWHPTCYDYPEKEYERISRIKVRSKFEAVARCLEIVKPRFYLPSAGPPCFLDPTLIHINFERTNIFPHAAAIIKYLNRRLKNSSSQVSNIMPGDILVVPAGKWIYETNERIDQENLETYIREYASLYTTYFQERARTYSDVDVNEVLQRLCDELEKKLEKFSCYKDVGVPLYFILNDAPGKILKVDFTAKKIETVQQIVESNYYSLTTNSWEIARIFDCKLNWEDFLLTFRFRLNREPDIYQTLIQAFLSIEAEDLDRFCEMLLVKHLKQERIVVEANGTRYAINRYCPHDGGDLAEGWIAGKTIMCPRHRWVFDLENGGKCKTSDCSIQAFPLDKD